MFPGNFNGDIQLAGQMSPILKTLLSYFSNYVNYLSPVHKEINTEIESKQLEILVAKQINVCLI